MKFIPAILQETRMSRRVECESLEADRWANTFVFSEEGVLNISTEYLYLSDYSQM